MVLPDATLISFVFAERNSSRIKKSAEFIDDDEDDNEAGADEDEVDESSINVADTVEVVTTTIESKHEHM